MTVVLKRTLLLMLCGPLLLGGVAVRAERMERFGEYEAHYSLVPTTMLGPELSTDYGVTRARDRALLTISIIGPDGLPVAATVSATVKDLLGRVAPVGLRELREGPAIYHLAEIRHDDRDVLRFAIDIRVADGTAYRLEFQQTMYWSDR